MRRALCGGKSGRLHLSFDDDVARDLRMHERRAILDRRTRIDDGCGFADVDRHAVGNIFGLRFAQSDGRSDGFADKSHKA